MASVEVDVLVQCLLSAFANGLGLFRSTRARQQPKRSKKKAEKMTEGEWQLQNSLQVRPKELRAGYDRMYAGIGRRFAIGDARAQTSLNQALSILNTGLTQFLDGALSRDVKIQALSRRSLLYQSELAAADALSALEELNARLSTRIQLALEAPRLPNRTVKDKNKDESQKNGTSKSRPSKPRSKSFSNGDSKRPGPDPQVRGAWVRSKSGTSTTSPPQPAGSSKTPKLPNPLASSRSPKQTPHHRAQSTPATNSKPTRDRPSSDHHESYKENPPPSYHSSPEQQSHRHPRRQASLLLASPDVFTDPTPTHHTFFHDYQQAPMPPPKIPLGAPLILSSRPRPPSIATFVSASTKFGEIPEHKWPTSSNNNALDQVSTRPLPYLLPPSLEDEQSPKRKGWGFKFWKRSGAIDVS